MRAAGRDPLLAGEPGSRAGLDRDGDGMTCESGGDAGDDGNGGGDSGGSETGGGDTGDADDADPRFSACAKAKAAGYGPYRREVDPEYHWYQDRDGDGDGWVRRAEPRPSMPLNLIFARRTPARRPTPR
ncbi:excalibur calcium-binding domain-containing protein [Micromonospora sp. 15K316]|uniref:excalibur calcium-binding domain-containing protein n=1 Tax=Micromonospora sp. 15K316 TaxID=2530376 RepID=UPI001FB5821A|nr:excalibur calcium-binding domain-containing protein [Micromonospora sp. 15K316]